MIALGIIGDSLKSLLKWVIVAVFIGSIGYGFYSYKTMKSLRSDNDRLNVNVESYEGIVSGLQDQNKTLTLTNEDIATSLDSVIVELDMFRNEKGIEGTELVAAYTNTTILTDTIKDTVSITGDCSFKKDFVFNDETIVSVEMSQDSVTVIPKVSNNQKLLVYDKRIYRNKYKNFFKRLIKFDFKKINASEYIIENSNELIENTKVRVILMENENN